MAGSALLSSFRQRNFRFFLTAESLTRVGDQVELVVLAWVVLVETGQPFLLGIFAALRFLGTLIAPLYGVLVDRYDRRLLLVGTRLVSTTMAIAILILAAVDLVQVWHLFVLSTISGLARTFSNVIREVLTADVVEPRLFANAIGLTRSATDLMQMIGPIVGGLLLKWYGIAPAYAPVVVVYLGSAIAGYMLRLPDRKRGTAKASLWRNLVEGGIYIRRNEVVLALLLMAFLANFAALSVKDVILPVFARAVLEIGPDGLGMLMSSLFAGAFVGSISIAGATMLQRGGRFLILASIVWHGIFLALAYSTGISVSMTALFLVGIFQSFTMVTMATLLIRATPEDMRGRVMGARSLAVYGLPMGVLVAGAISGSLGAPAAIVVIAIVGVVATLLIAVYLKRLWYSSESHVS